MNVGVGVYTCIWGIYKIYIYIYTWVISVGCVQSLVCCFVSCHVRASVVLLVGCGLVCA